MSVSVILTCHNEEHFIVQAVESVINQTASSHVKEIIIVNDGSTDRSREIIASLADREPRLHVLTTAGIGPSSARNLAIKHATGDFVAILDGDDFWAEDKLERQLDVFGNGCKAGLVYGDLVDFSAPDLSDALHVAVGRYRADQTDTLPKYFLLDGPIVPSSIVMRREVVEDIGLFNETLRVGEDTEFCMRVAERWTFQHVAGALVYKRRHGSNTTRRLDALLPAAEHLTREWVRRRPELAHLARRRNARLYAKAGNDCVAQGEKKRGACLLIRAMRHDPWSWRVYIYIFLCALPRAMEPQVRRAAKLLFYRAMRKRPC
ncbi:MULTISPECIES: glycosyltransferase family 2 protein [unclassified Mesorhizobium]|uniref:glycosyltransferase family 2 protein n=1 Tax=unclassified Mesorhizobium TaxID=325217 RepID=UPI000FCCB0FB|nr:MULTISPECIES: glycosyltransferase family 2 protein [unclassified Mesorhizobium]TGP23438.1 glycosyltransferase [Mesorhizobium sp. M1D.F.Ca.ET.231.01.1.1]TGP33580.1 glycosyltransferase [Mesorhizobium sp. M1D.F.Ca.ET.234.01.1.1]TGS46947.1 glycosyltransferase [Mesorhizobium sp. M1D.F.Ca.ET.184.01.1.1]TGS62206.1 glycosyltransferase [Mesorhizobium sp. M1D.F.Ca.ET.183.01.1.1]